MCRELLCPLFHIRQGSTCHSTKINLGEIPKLAIIRFQERNETSKRQNPFMNIENDFRFIMENILLEIFSLPGPLESMPVPPSELMISLYVSFYQRQGEIEREFLFEYTWLSFSDEELVPKAFIRFFDVINVKIPIPHTSSIFEARSISNFVKHDQDITIDQVKYKRIFWKDIRDIKHNIINMIPINESRYLPMNPLILCNRVALSLSTLTLSNTSFYRQSSDIGVKLPEDYIITESFVEMCADDYFRLTAQALASPVNNFGYLRNPIDDMAIILSFVCSSVSIICLLITIATYLLFESLRTLPGKINMCLCVSLTVAQALQQFTIDIIEYRLICIICGVLIHFSWSATLCWMSVSSFNLFRCFSPSNISRRGSPSSLGMYAIFVFVMSTLLVVANFMHGLVGADGLGYGGRICYISSDLGLLLTFVAPVGIIVLSNLAFLSVTIWRISNVPKIKGKRSAERNNVVIYMKMSTLTGFCWIFGFLGILTKVKVFEILFILMNASQGLFLMISFVCNKRVLGLLKECLSK